MKVFVEGATRGHAKGRSTNIEFRRAFSRFAEKLGVALRPTFIPCGGRSQTWDAAWNSFLHKNTGELILLLVDSEEPCTFPLEDAWKHLHQKDGWHQLDVSHGKYVFLMVTAMETWLVADRIALQRFYGPAFHDSRIPAWQALESVPKEDVLAALTRASSGQFSKGEHSFVLLAEIDPRVLSEACPHARRFCESLRMFCS